MAKMTKDITLKNSITGTAFMDYSTGGIFYETCYLDNLPHEVAVAIAYHLIGVSNWKVYWRNAQVLDGIIEKMGPTLNGLTLERHPGIIMTQGGRAVDTFHHARNIMDNFRPQYGEPTDKYGTNGSKPVLGENDWSGFTKKLVRTIDKMTCEGYCRSLVEEYMIQGPCESWKKYVDIVSASMWHDPNCPNVIYGMLALLPRWGENAQGKELEYFRPEFASALTGSRHYLDNTNKYTNKYNGTGRAGTGRSLPSSYGSRYYSSTNGWSKPGDISVSNHMGHLNYTSSFQYDIIVESKRKYRHSYGGGHKCSEIVKSGKRKGQQCGCAGLDYVITNLDKYSAMGRMNSTCFLANSTNHDDYPKVVLSRILCGKHDTLKQTNAFNKNLDKNLELYGYAINKHGYLIQIRRNKDC